MSPIPNDPGIPNPLAHKTEQEFPLSHKAQQEFQPEAFADPASWNNPYPFIIGGRRGGKGHQPTVAISAEELGAMVRDEIGSQADIQLRNTALSYAITSMEKLNITYTRGVVVELAQEYYDFLDKGNNAVHEHE